MLVVVERCAFLVLVGGTCVAVRRCGPGGRGRGLSCLLARPCGTPRTPAPRRPTRAFGQHTPLVQLCGPEPPGERHSSVRRSQQNVTRFASRTIGVHDAGHMWEWGRPCADVLRPGK